MEKPPCRPILSEPAFIRRRQLRLPLFVGIDPGTILLAPLEGSPPRRTHPAIGFERADAGDVDRAPGAAGLSRREAVDVSLGVQALADSVDPAHAERLVHGLRP